ncbi:hypothetical protein M427DRAFT_62594 [Gonapodya prolifera JEL478]|uniref:Uncharacterized protein n=1 Tax=Gonapodya prolifera (strain JEL478) TaxID=1344416 RepID=A0A139A0K2_GONPJ|nr:hypothetical protein M427DRAFT_62594 [Gonapodya prolifera JEL478]|eukprot:KXS10300.1 hypothetical protein M427DRAFT_62594 [Gonapodya prolifera JEL478]
MGGVLPLPFLSPLRHAAISPEQEIPVHSLPRNRHRLSTIRRPLLFVSLALFLLLAPLSALAQSTARDCAVLESIVTQSGLAYPWPTGACCAYANARYTIACNADGRVIQILARGLGLSGTLPSFAGLNNLQVLDLVNNNLVGNIPDLSSNTALYTLALQRNSLSGPIDNILPLSLVDCQLTQRQSNTGLYSCTNAFPQVCQGNGANAIPVGGAACGVPPPPPAPAPPPAPPGTSAAPVPAPPSAAPTPATGGAGALPTSAPPSDLSSLPVQPTATLSISGSVTVVVTPSPLLIGAGAGSTTGGQAASVTAGGAGFNGDSPNSGSPKGAGAGSGSGSGDGSGNSTPSSANANGTSNSQGSSAVIAHVGAAVGVVVGVALVGGAVVMYRRRRRAKSTQPPRSTSEFNLAASSNSSDPAKSLYIGELHTIPSLSTKASNAPSNSIKSHVLSRSAAHPSTRLSASATSTSSHTLSNVYTTIAPSPPSSQSFSMSSHVQLAGAPQLPPIVDVGVVGQDAPHWAFVQLVPPLFHARASYDVQGNLMFQAHMVFQATSSDEIGAHPDEWFKIKTVYRDGWSYALSVDRQVMGLVPMDCLIIQDGEHQSSDAVSSRVESLAMAHSALSFQVSIQAPPASYGGGGGAGWPNFTLSSVQSTGPRDEEAHPGVSASTGVTRADSEKEKGGESKPDGL